MYLENILKSTLSYRKSSLDLLRSTLEEEFERLSLKILSRHGNLLQPNISGPHLRMCKDS